MHELRHHVDLTFGQNITKRRHAVAAIGDLSIYLVLGVKLELARAQARYFGAVVEDLPLRLRAVTDGAILSEEGRLVHFAVGNYKPVRGRTKARTDGDQRCREQNK